MNLSPQERDKLLIYLAAQVAKDRESRGPELNVPEATALITAELMEMAREGKSVAEILKAGREILRRDGVMNGVPEMISMIQVEPKFKDGRTRRPRRSAATRISTRSSSTARRSAAIRSRNCR